MIPTRDPKHEPEDREGARQPGWLAGWLVGCQAGRLAGWLAAWLAGWLAASESLLAAKMSIFHRFYEQNKNGLPLNCSQSDCFFENIVFPKV